MKLVSQDKIKIIDGKVIVAGTGEIGLGQRFHNQLNLAWQAKNFQKSCIECSTLIAGMACKDFLSSHTPLYPGQGYGFGAIVAAPFSDKAEVVEFATTNMQPEIKAFPLHFVAMGSGQMLAEPFLAFVRSRGQSGTTV